MKRRFYVPYGGYHEDPNQPAPQVMAASAYGGYPMLHHLADGAILCAHCVRDKWSLLHDPEDKQWYVVQYESGENYDEAQVCAHCYKEIK